MAVSRHETLRPSPMSASDKVIDLDQRMRPESDDESVEVGHPDTRLAMLESLSDGLAHELNSPLQILNDSFRLLVEMNQAMLDILDDIEHTAPTKAQIDQEELDFVRNEFGPAQQRVRLGLERVKDVVDTFKVFAGKQNSPFRESLNLQKALTQATLPYHSEDIEIRVTATAHEAIFATQEDIDTIVGELVENAKHATLQSNSPVNSPVTVLGSVVNDLLLIEVSDRGVGIPADLQQRVFDPFFSTRPDGVHRGRGLCMVDQLVRTKYKGSIAFRSVLGEGTTFHVKLPFNNPT